MNKEANIVRLAIDAAPKRPGLKYGRFRPAGAAEDRAIDGRLDIDYKGHSHAFAVRVKTHLHNALIDRMLADHPGLPPAAPRLLVISDQIGAKHAAMLTQKGVAFLDTAGNAFLDLPGLYLSITGRKSSTPAQRPRPGRAFQPSGLRLVFACLTDPFLDRDPSKAIINQTFRTIKQRTGVAVGSIGRILDDLGDAGFVVVDDKMRLIVDRRRLVQKWTDNYIDRLMPKQDAGRYAASGQDWWRDIHLDPAKQLWGGEVAAARLTGFLKPQQVTVYAKSEASNLILDARLRLDPDGDVQLLHAFWGDWPHAAHDDCVHPLLIYADLLASGIDRNMETARRVYDGYLHSIVEPD
ncbi:MAG: hypothetical protein ISS31_04505 [Kiritimatiellae bacterium]|nr:hypothetical protein [Kiritimatiellia bacterium]